MAKGWSGYDDWRKKADESGYYFSDIDLANAAYDEGFANEIYGAKEDFANADTPEKQAAAQARAETARSGFNYSGGADGSEYIKLPSSEKSSVSANVDAANQAYQAALDLVRSRGTYTDPYQGMIDQQLSAAFNPTPFSYDYRTDPAWQAYKKEYTREGRRASEDALAQAAMMTGGVPSSYAQTAAQQAGNYYAAQMSDKIPELYKLAYEMYAEGQDRKLQGLNAARGVSDMYYGRYGDQFNRGLSMLDAARTMYGDAYGAYQDQRDYADARNDLAYNRAWNEEARAYERQQNEQARLWEEAAARAAVGDWSGYEALGVTPDMAQLLQYTLAGSGRTVPVGSGGSGGSRAGGGGDADAGAAAEDATPNQLRLFMDALNSGISPANYIATYYKDYGFDKSSGLVSEFNKWVKENNPTSPQEWEIGMPELLPGYTPGFGAARLETLGGGAGSGGMTGPSGLDYSPDEGVFTWNGKTFSSVSALAAAIDSADLSDAEKEKLSRALGAYGFDVSFV